MPILVECSRSGRMWGVTHHQLRCLALLPCLALAACSNVDAGAVAACRSFRSLMADSRAGVLTEAEARKRMQELNELATGAEDVKVREGARAMLAGATTGNTEQARGGGRRLATACEAHRDR